MRIGIVTGEYPPMQGGVGDFSRELALALVRRGLVIHVLTDARCGVAGPGDGAGVCVHPIARGWGWHSLGRLRATVRGLDLDLLDIQYQAAAFGMTLPIHFLPRLAGAPTVVTFHDLRVPYLFPRAGGLRRRAVRMLARGADGVIVTDPADEQTLRNDAKVRRLTQIPIGSNIPNRPPADYDRGRWRRELGVAVGEVLIGHFGFLNHSKGGETLIRALAEVARRGVPARLALIGGRAGASDPTDREYGQRLEAEIARLGIEPRILHTGFVGPEQVSGHLLACDLVALPYLDGASLRRGSLMAALAHGCAIVTTRPTSPIPELRHEGNLLLVRSESPADLAVAIQRVANDSALRDRLRAGALSLSAPFSWDGIAARTEAFFEDVLRVPRGAMA